MDFGSNSYGTTLYTRSVRAIFCDTVLLQLKQSDAEEILGPMTPELTFSSPEEMIAKTSSVLRSRERRDSIRTTLRALSSSKGGMDRALSVVLADLGCEPSTSRASEPFR